MKTENPYNKKFKTQYDRIKDLEKNNERFKRVYSEYQLMSEELWNLENVVGTSIPDDFIDSIKTQTHYLEEEIEDWLYSLEKD